MESSEVQINVQTLEDGEGQATGFNRSVRRGAGCTNQEIS